MIITEQERKDMVTLFNAQDAATKLRSATLNINGAEVIVYETGEIEKTSRRRRVHTRTFGSMDGKGYLCAKVDDKVVKVHRLVAQAFLGDYSESLQVDHIDGDRANNATENLRMVTNRQNQLGFKRVTDGASSRFRGVCWSKSLGKWLAQIKANGKQVYIGVFEDEKRAALAYNRKAAELGFDKMALNII